jgi:hypothetical protein
MKVRDGNVDFFLLKSKQVSTEIPFEKESPQTDKHKMDKFFTAVRKHSPMRYFSSERKSEMYTQRVNENNKYLKDTDDDIIIGFEESEEKNNA